MHLIQIKDWSPSITLTKFDGLTIESMDFKKINGSIKHCYITKLRQPVDSANGLTNFFVGAYALSKLKINFDPR